jgi:isopenicillin N synthase-like dioxygenase
VVNIGELLELASNGYLRATVHRVVPSAPGQERLSIAFFLGPSSTPWCRYPLPEALAREVRGPATDPAQSAAAGGGWNYTQGAAAFSP